MSKAEEAALKVFPQKIEGDSRGSYDLNELNRQKFLLGYHQAEKDLELTWKDFKFIHEITFETNRNVARNYNGEISEKEFYQEVLKRFKEMKEK